MENEEMVVVPNEESSRIPAKSCRVLARQYELKNSKSVRELAKKFECKETLSSKSEISHPTQCGQLFEARNVIMKSFIPNHSPSPIAKVVEIEEQIPKKIQFDFPLSSSSPIGMLPQERSPPQNLGTNAEEESMIEQNRKSLTPTASFPYKSIPNVEHLNSQPDTSTEVSLKFAQQSVLMDENPSKSIIEETLKPETPNQSSNLTSTFKTIKISTTHIPLSASHSVPNVSCYSDVPLDFLNSLSQPYQPTLKGVKSLKADKFPKIKVTEDSVPMLQAEISDSLSIQEPSELVIRNDSINSDQTDLLVDETGHFKRATESRNSSLTIPSNITEPDCVVSTAVRRTSKNQIVTPSNPQTVSEAINGSSMGPDSSVHVTGLRTRNTKSRIFSPSMRPLSSIFMASTKSASTFVRSFTSNSNSKTTDQPNSLNDLKEMPEINISSETSSNKSQESSSGTSLGILQKGKSFFRGHFSRKSIKSHPKMFGILVQESSQKNSLEVSPAIDQEDSQSEHKKTHPSSISFGDTSSDSSFLESSSSNTNMSFMERRKIHLQKLDNTAKKEHKKRQTRVKNVVATLLTEKKIEKLQESALDALVMELVSIGFFNFDDRDDIYFELISMIQKMLLTKEKSKCLVRGFDLLSKCACFFSCSSENSEYFIHIIEELYFSELKNRQDIIRGAYVLNIFMQHFCVYYSESVKLEPALIKSTDAIVARYSFFDSTLNEIMEMQTIKYPYHQLPWIVIELCESVLMNNGRNSEGIFRLSGDSLMVDDLRKNMLIFRCPPTITDPNISASLLKSWFRDIVDPMISVDMYDACIQAHNQPTTVCQIVLSLPKLHRDIICYITKFVRLFMLDQFVKVTRMDYSNMALVWSPNLLRSPHTDPLTISTFTSSQNSFIKNVFENLDISCIDNIAIHESLDSKTKI